MLTFNAVKRTLCAKHSISFWRRTHKRKCKLQGGWQKVVAAVLSLNLYSAMNRQQNYLAFIPKHSSDWLALDRFPRTKSGDSGGIVQVN